MMNCEVVAGGMLSGMLERPYHASILPAPTTRMLNRIHDERANEPGR
jgi:hypothetical protein